MEESEKRIVSLGHRLTKDAYVDIILKFGGAREASSD